MIIKYDNNVLINKVVPEINSAKSKISTAQMYNTKITCPRDFKCYNLLVQIINELNSDVNRLTTLSNNIDTKNQRIISIDRNVKSMLSSNRLENVSTIKRKI